MMSINSLNLYSPAFAGNKKGYRLIQREALSLLPSLSASKQNLLEGFVKGQSSFAVPEHPRKAFRFKDFPEVFLNKIKKLRIFKLSRENPYDTSQKLMKYMVDVESDSPIVSSAPSTSSSLASFQKYLEQFNH